MARRGRRISKDWPARGREQTGPAVFCRGSDNAFGIFSATGHPRLPIVFGPSNPENASEKRSADSCNYHGRSRGGRRIGAAGMPPVRTNAGDRLAGFRPGQGTGARRSRPRKRPESLLSRPRHRLRMRVFNHDGRGLLEAGKTLRRTISREFGGAGVARLGHARRHSGPGGFGLLCSTGQKSPRPAPPPATCRELGRRDTESRQALSVPKTGKRRADCPSPVLARPNRIILKADYVVTRLSEGVVNLGNHQPLSAHPPGTRHPPE